MFEFANGPVKVMLVDVASRAHAVVKPLKAHYGTPPSICISEARVITK